MVPAICASSFHRHSAFGLRQFFSPLASHFSSLSPRQLERVGQSLLPTHRAPFLLRLFGCSRSDSFARGRQISLAKFHPKRNLIYHGRLQFRKTSARCAIKAEPFLRAARAHQTHRHTLHFGCSFHLVPVVERGT